MKKRLFIAIHIDASNSLLSIFETIRHDLNKEKIRWVDPHNLHLTLIFLGETEITLIDNIVSVMDSIIRNFVQFDVELNSLGIFKSISFPSVLWFGFRHGNIMSDIKSFLDIQLRTLGFTIEERKFKPHLTIGRIKNIDDKYNFQNILETYTNKEIAKQTVKEVALYESVLASTGPIYKIIHRSFLK